MFRKQRTFVGDFETTVYAGQDRTEVWASAICEIGTEDGLVFHSISETFAYLQRQKCNIILYYHNLKFDGSFWLHMLLSRGWRLAAEETAEGIRFVEMKDMQKGSFRYSISSVGVWYSIDIRTEQGFTIQIRDSLKLLPASVEELGKSFKTKHRKLTMEYEGYRYAGCPITEQEKQYILNDVYVVKECLEIMFAEGHDRMTIGSCALHEFQKQMDSDYPKFFPDLKSEKCPIEGYASVHDYMVHYYKGAFCYVHRKGLHRNGITLDVTSLYPSVMHSCTGFKQPIGKPIEWLLSMPEKVDRNKYYFFHIRCSFQIREGHIPCIQIKDNPLYRGNEWLATSDIRTEGGYRKQVSVYGEIFTNVVDLYMTEYDYDMFMRHYYVDDFQFVDGVAYYQHDIFFDQYIDKFIKQKNESEGAMRQIAKLFLNSLYGKFGSSDNSSFKLAYLDESGTIKYEIVEAHDKETVYIPAGIAITSAGRFFTITHAQENIDAFCYADTDSLHLCCKPEDVKLCEIADKKLGAWKLESQWDMAYFCRQKTYIEHVTHEGEQELEKAYYEVKACGMGKRPKKLIQAALSHDMTRLYDTVNKPDGTEEKILSLKEDEKEFLEKGMGISDFDVGLSVPGNLKARNIPGGILLVREPFVMR